MFFDIVMSNIELGVSPESIIDEAYDLWQKGIVSDNELDNFFAFVESIDHTSETKRKITWLSILKDDKSVSYKPAAKRKTQKRTIEKQKYSAKRNNVDNNMLQEVDETGKLIQKRTRQTKANVADSLIE